MVERSAIHHDLAEKLGRRERDDLEFKRNVSDRNAIREAVCAMANDLPGRGVGHLLIGVDDNGTSSGLPVNDALLSFLAGLRTEGRILPPPILVVERSLFDGHECAHVEIRGSPSPPIRFDGRVFVRVGPSTRQATRDEERLLAERRRVADRPFDQRPLSGASLRDLDLELFRSTYLPAAISPDVIAENDRIITDQLASLRLLDSALNRQDDPGLPSRLDDGPVGPQSAGCRSRSASQSHLCVFDESQLERFWDDDGASTVLGGVLPILRGLGDIRIPEVSEVAEGLWVLPGDLGLSRFEDKLSEAWPHGYDGDEAALRVTTSFHRMLRGITKAVGAQVVIVDVGPNLGAINRAALLGADDLLVPLAADLFSLQGLRNLGPTIRSWRVGWQRNVLPRAPEALDVPTGAMRPIGYVVLQHAVRLDRPVKAYERWLRRIPTEFHKSVLGEEQPPPETSHDPYRLASLRNYRSLMPLAQDARKPMFDLRPADGALGSMGRLVQICYREFEDLAKTVLRVSGAKSLSGSYEGGMDPPETPR